MKLVSIFNVTTRISDKGLKSSKNCCARKKNLYDLQKFIGAKKILATHKIFRCDRLILRNEMK